MGDNDDGSELLHAIQDLTRVTIALSGRFESKADSIRQLIELGIAPVRVASLLAIPSKQVYAELAKAKRRGAKK